MRASYLIKLYSILALLFTLRAVFAGSALNQKPVYHITPEEGHWINDPNGPFYHSKTGLYHLFAQYNPHGSVWGNMSWIHWSSSDLVFWNKLGVAITNDQDYDIGGAFSGSCILTGENGTLPKLIYTCVDASGYERQCMAVPSNSSDPFLNKWDKYLHNPFLDYTCLPNGYDPLQFRDPSLWKSEDGLFWWAAFAAKIDGVGTVAVFNCTATIDSCGFHSILWNSSDRNSSYNTYMVECPDFFEMGPDICKSDTCNDRFHVLKFSVMEERRELYEIGKYIERQGRFVRDVEGYPNRLEFDHGPDNNFYASKSFLDKNNRRILWGWSPEQAFPENGFNSSQNWAGAMALPRVMVFSKEAQTLLFQPLPELNNLRIDDSHKYYPKVRVSTESTTDTGANFEVDVNEYLWELPGVSSINLEASCTFVIYIHESLLPDCKMEVGFLGRASKKPYSKLPSSFLKHSIAVSFSGRSQISASAVIDTRKAGGSTPSYLNEKHYNGSVSSFYNSEARLMRVPLRMFYDHSIIEMYGFDGAIVSTNRVYLDESNSKLYLYAKMCNGEMSSHITAMNVNSWEMKSLWV